MTQPPIWTPKTPSRTHMANFIRFVETHYQQSFADYPAVHRWSVEHTESFWEAVSRFFNLPFHDNCEFIFKKTGPHPWDQTWFGGSTFNFAERLLKGEPSKIALISHNEQNIRRNWTYDTLKQAVLKCAVALKQAGLTKGDRVAAVLPNIPETIIAMLATAACGAIWASCSPDFGTDSILERFQQIEPSFLFIGNGYQYGGKSFPLSEDKLTGLIQQLPSLKQTILVPILDHTLQASKLCDWPQFLEGHSVKNFEFEAFPFSHPLYILFSSGTTGKPKCIIHGAGNTLIQHIKELGLHTNLSQNDTLFFYTTCGWMMWNWMVSGLSLGLTLVVYDGAPLYPEMGKLFQLIQTEKITAFGTSAKYLSTIEKMGFASQPDHAFPSLKTILSTGSPLLCSQYDFVYHHLASDVMLSSISGGTDIVSCFGVGNPMLPVYRGEIQCLGLGMNVKVLNRDGTAVIDEKGELVALPPFPSMPLGFFNDANHERFAHAYFEKFTGFWTHGDFATLTSRGGLIIFGRSDTTLNRGGVRIGTAEIYHEIEKMPAILESVVANRPKEDDIEVLLFVKLNQGATLTDALKKEISQRLKEHVSPRHVPDLIIEVPDIPKTFNGKVVELAVQQTLNHLPIENLRAIANPEALAYFKLT